MSTQAASVETPFAVSEPLQNLRLVELPPEVLDLLSAPNPPRLRFKSSVPGTSNKQSLLSSPANKAAEHLHLCTETQSYQVRQVSTSNSVYVIEPSIAHPTSRDGDEGMEIDDEPAHASSAMIAIAKVDTMLELIPISHDVNAMLDRVLPTYDAPEGLPAERETQHFLSHSTTVSKSNLFSDLPAPDSQCEKAWRDLLAFECEGRCARPSASTSLSIWQSILNEATLERVDLTGEFDIKSLFQNEQASEINSLVGEAVFLYLDGKVISNSRTTSVQIDRPRTVSWTGLVLLQARWEKPSPKPVLLKDDYIHQWQDLLPETWRDEATLGKLPKDSFIVEVVEDKDTITWNELGETGAGLPPVAAAEGAKSTSGKRKWHEKFKAQRKEIKK